MNVRTSGAPAESAGGMVLRSSPGPVTAPVSTADMESGPGTVTTSPSWRETSAPSGAKRTSRVSTSSERERPCVHATVASADAITAPRPPTTR